MRRRNSNGVAPLPVGIILILFANVRTDALPLHNKKRPMQDDFDLLMELFEMKTKIAKTTTTSRTKGLLETLNHSTMKNTFIDDTMIDLMKEPSSIIFKSFPSTFYHPLDVKTALMTKGLPEHRTLQFENPGNCTNTSGGDDDDDCCSFCPPSLLISNRTFRNPFFETHDGQENITCQELSDFYKTFEKNSQLCLGDKPIFELACCDADFVSCATCANNDQPEGNMSIKAPGFESYTCSDIFGVTSLIAASSTMQCFHRQAYSHVYCGCPAPPSPPEGRCTPCADGSSSFNATAFFPFNSTYEMQCSYLHLMTPFHHVDGTGECEWLQYLAFQHCGCPTRPKGICHVCAGNGNIDPSATIPMEKGPDLSCLDTFQDVPNTIPAESNLCTTVQRTTFMYCGCPEPPSTPEGKCHPCANGGSINVTNVVPFYDISCKDLAVIVPDEYEEGSEDCLFFQRLGYEHCGCPSPPIPPEGSCTVCAGGVGTITNSTTAVVPANPNNPDSIDLPCWLFDVEVPFIYEEGSESCISAQYHTFLHCGCPMAPEGRCSPCAGGEGAINDTAIIPSDDAESMKEGVRGEVPCSRLANDIQHKKEGSPNCTLDQYKTYLYCGCPSRPALPDLPEEEAAAEGWGMSTCTICHNGSLVPEESIMKEVQLVTTAKDGNQTTTATTCGEAEYALWKLMTTTFNEDAVSTCKLYQESLSVECGCQKTVNDVGSRGGSKKGKTSSSPKRSYDVCWEVVFGPLSCFLLFIVFLF